MPGAHGPIFCCKELREKVGVKVRFFSRTKSQRTQTDFLSELLCVTIAGDVSLLDDVTPIFYRTEVSAHGRIFCRKQLREKIGAILYRSKSQRTRTDFHSDFLSTIKESVHVRWALSIMYSCCPWAYLGFEVSMYYSVIVHEIHSRYKFLHDLAGFNFSKSCFLSNSF